MRRNIIYLASFLLVVVGFGACYLYNFYEYKSVFILPNKSDSRIKLTDSLFIYPNLTIESHVGTMGNQVMAASINFEDISDSIIVKTLNVQISCIDNPQQNIYMTHVITYADPLIPEDIEYVRANKFDEFPDHYKTVTLKREPWNTFRFYFETKNINLGATYNYKFSGNVLYNGKLINFGKEIKVERKKRFIRIHMMT
jgi:hypothetical protein